MLNILGKRYWFFALSLVIIISGLILLVSKPLPLSIDFKGGTLVELQFTSSSLPSTEQVKAVYDELGVKDPQIQTSGSDTLILRSTELSDAQRQSLIANLSSLSEQEVVVLKSDTVGPSIGEGVAKRALVAVALAALAVVVYITFAFRGVQHAFRYGICAIIAMIHDVLIVLALTGYGSTFWGWQIDSLYLTALLTVIGFSVQDKIVVFDRIRENSGI